MLIWITSHRKLRDIVYIFIYLIYLCFWGKVSYSTVWFWNCYLAETGIKLPISQMPEWQVYSTKRCFLCCVRDLPQGSVHAWQVLYQPRYNPSMLWISERAWGSLKRITFFLSIAMCFLILFKKTFPKHCFSDLEVPKFFLRMCKRLKYVHVNPSRILKHCLFD